MDFNRACYGCFSEKSGSTCPYCGYNPESEEHPVLALPAGTILGGRYVTGRVLGLGGFGITYLGYDLTLDIKVAIKEYMPAGMAMRHTDRYTMTLIASRDEANYRGGEERFLDEARILAKLQNLPNIVSVQNYFKENNTAYFVMDYVDGMSLKEFVRQQGGKIPSEQALAILLPVMEALIAVHAQSLLHRDISPDNIYITSDGKSKLLDFGAARFALGDEKSISVILKHGYAPEEQYRSHGNQGPWTDVYAMGATLYHCTTGILPPDSIDRLHKDALLPPSRLGVRIPPAMETSLMKALAVKAEDRFPNMEAFIGALSGRTSLHQQVHATVAAASAAFAAPGAAGRNAPASPGTAAAAERLGLSGLLGRLIADKKRLAFIAGGGALLLLAIVLPIALLSGKRGGGEAVSGGASASAPGQAPSFVEAASLPALPAAEPGSNSAAASTKTVTHDGLNISMQVSRDFTEQSNEKGILFQRGEFTTLAAAFGYYSGHTMFTLDEFVEHRDAIMANEILYLELPESTKVTGGERVTLGALPAYRADMQIGDGGAYDFMAYAVQAKEGYGCYLIYLRQSRADPNYERHVQENAAMLQSLSLNGAPDTGLVLCESENVGVRFVYDRTLCPGGAEDIPATSDTVAGIWLYPFGENDDASILIECASAYASDMDGFFAASEEMVEENVGKYEAGKPYSLQYGGLSYTVKDYSIQVEGDGTTYFYSLGATQIGGRLYSVGAFYTDLTRETVLTLAYHVMTTLTPLT